jgi:hypothetical protein
MQDIKESLSASLRRTKISMNMLLTMNDFDWFWTLTFDKSKIDRENDTAVFRAYKKYINNVKKQCPDFKYMCFPERHEDGCIHFHLLVSGITVKQMGLADSGKVCCSWAYKKQKVSSKEYFEKTKQQHINELKDTDGEPIYNITNFIYGYTTVSKIVSRERCNTYVKKYVEKALGSTDIFKKRFYYSSNLNVPETVKKIIDADFTEPKDIDKVSIIKENPLLSVAKYEPYISEHNVMQVRVANKDIQSINCGLVPIKNNFESPFNNEQLKIDDIF